MEPGLDSSAYAQIALPALSLPLSVLLLAVVLPLAAIVGWAFGSAARSRAEARGREIDVAIGDTTLGGIMALLGLILAFTFGNALSSFQDRSDALLAEANALGTAFLRAELLPDTEALALQTAIRDYAHTRLVPDGGASGREELEAYLDVTLAAQGALWPAMLEATAEPVPAPVRTFVAGSLNDVIDAHLVRLMSFSAPLLPVTQVVTLSISLVALFILGNRSGIRGKPLTWRTFLFSAVLLGVIGVIQDIQRSEQGFVRIDDGSLRLTLADMERALAGR